jgi:hypothetical protein
MSYLRYNLNLLTKRNAISYSFTKDLFCLGQARYFAFFVKVYNFVSPLC